MKDLLTIILVAFSYFMHLVSPQTSTEKTFNLEIKFENIQKTDKPIYVALYQSKKDFNNKKIFKKYTVLPSQKTTLVIQDLPEGTYALLCFQDINDNHRLDFNGYVPDEPWGLSNNITRMGPPTWTDAAFKLNRNLQLNIELF